MDNNKAPVTGEIFTNDKGQIFQVVTIARHSVTKEKLVIYQDLYGDFSVKALPVEMFLSTKKKIQRPVKNSSDEKTGSLNNSDKTANSNVNNSLDSNNKISDISDNNTKTGSKKNRNIRLSETEIKIESYKDECPEGMNLLLYAFLEADTVREKLKLIRDMDNRKYIDDKCIDDMAASIDVTIDEGDIFERIRQLIYCLDTMKRFEVIRR